MVKFCKMCGTPLQEGVRFCPKCGATIGQAAFQQPPVQPQQPMYQPQTNTYQQPMAPQQPYYGQTQSYAPLPKKSNKKLIIAVIAIIAIILIIGLLVFFFVSAGGDEDKFVGTWEIESITTESDLNGIDTQPAYGVKMTFKSDGTLEMSAMGTTLPGGSWEIKNGKICIKQAESSNESCAQYKFSNGDKTLTITSSDTVENWDGTKYIQKTTTVLKKVTTSSNGDGNGENNVNDYAIEDILGSWDMAEDPTYGSSYSQIWTFYSNGSMKMDYTYTYSDDAIETSTYTTWANYELKNNQLCLNYTEYSFETCYGFEITNNGNTLTTTYYSITSTFTKIT